MEYVLSDIIELIGGGTPKTSVPEYWGGDIPWLSVKDFSGEKRYVYETEKYITEAGLNNSSTKYLNQDDIIVSARGTVGEMAMIPFPMTFNQSCYGIRAKRQLLDPFYLYYLMKYNLGVLKSKVHGSVFDTITKDTFKQITVQLPDLEVQKKVADILGNLDEKIENNEKINRNLLDQGRVLYEELISNYKVNTKLCDLISSIETGSRPKGGAQESGVPSIGAEKIESFGVYDYSGEKYISEEFFEKLKRGRVLSGDVLLYKDGAYTGKTSMALNDFPHAKCAINEHVYKLNSNENKYQFFLYFTLDNKKNRDYIYTLASSKAAQPGLNQTELLSVEIVMPDETALIEFEENVSQMMKMIASNAKENRKLTILRDSLLPKLMSGELDVSGLYI